MNIQLNRKNINKHLKESYFKMDLTEFNKYYKDLTDSERFLMIVLYKFRDRNGLSYPSLETIKSIMDSDSNEIAIQSISRSLGNLKDKGFISISKIGDTDIKRNQYRILNPPEIKFEDKIMVSFLVNKKLNWVERLFLMQIYPYIFDDSNKIKFSNKQISDALNLSYNTTNKRITYLEQLGILVKSEGGYTVNMQAVLGMNDEEVLNFINGVVKQKEILQAENEDLKKENALLKSQATSLQAIVVSLEKQLKAISEKLRELEEDDIFDDARHLNKK